MQNATPRAEVVRLPIVGVMGSHAHGYPERSRRVGEWIARQGCHLLTGAGGGVMETVSRAFAEVPERVGRVLGIVPTSAHPAGRVALPGYPNPWVEIPVVTHLDTGGARGDEPTSRNHVNVLTASVVIILPGATGTASEARLALLYGRPCIAFLRGPEEVPELPAPVPLTFDFDQVATFVTDAITAQGWPSGGDRGDT